MAMDSSMQTNGSAHQTGRAAPSRARPEAKAGAAFAAINSAEAGTVRSVEPRKTMNPPKRQCVRQNRMCGLEVPRGHKQTSRGRILGHGFTLSIAFRAP
ncbi:hypothetical protein JCM14124_10820 [Humidesulfovibrio idahonensis]